MPAAPAKPATTPIPVQLSASEFTEFLFPHLSISHSAPLGWRFTYFPRGMFRTDSKPQPWYVVVA
jgi:hypothetical protein